MQRLIVILAILLGSTWLGFWIMAHPGQVVIIASPWMLQFSLGSLAIFGVLFLILFYLTVNSFDRLQFSWTRLKHWFRLRKMNRVLSETKRGLLALFAGNLKEAERSLVQIQKLDKAQFKQFEILIYQAMLTHSLQDKTLSAIQRTWVNAPRDIREHPQVILCYVKALIYFNEYSDAAHLIQKTLKQAWQDELVTIYSHLPNITVSRKLGTLGTWLKQYGDEPSLLLALGITCTEEKLWGKAKEYFERCLRFDTSREVYLAYGALLQQLHEDEAALEKYRLALINSSHGLTRDS